MSIDLGMFPALESVFLWGIFLFFLLIFGFAAYASYRKKVGNPIKGVTIKDGGAFVGTIGSGLSLNIATEGSTLRVRWARSNYIIILLCFFVFGPGLTLVLILFPEKINDGIPTPVWGIMGMFMLGSFWGFVYYLKVFMYEEPVIEVSMEGIRLLRGKVEEDSVRKRDILSFRIEVSHHVSSGKSRREYDNYTLIVKAEGDKEVRLCITDNKEQVEGLKRDLETKLQVQPADQSGQPPV